MAKTTNILIGVGVLSVIGYLLYKKQSNTSDSSIQNELVIQKELFKNAKIPTDITTNESNNVKGEDTPIIHPITGKLSGTSNVEMPPIIIDYSGINPNIGSSLVNMNIVDTDPFAQYQNCHTMAEYNKLKASGQPIPLDYCIIQDKSGPSDKEIQQNAFRMQDVKNELSPDAIGLNTFMRQSGAIGGSRILPRSEEDPYGYGGIPS
jgi:hypothetical protein